MNEKHDEDWRQAMYGLSLEDDLTDEMEVPSSRRTIDQSGRTVTIHDNFRTVTVPSVEYVAKLEQEVASLRLAKIAHERRLRQLDTAVNNLLRAINKDVKDLKRQIDGKVSLRGWDD